MIDTATNTVTATIPTGAAPTFVAISPDGTRAYVTINADGLLSVIDTATNAIVADVAVAGASVVAASPDGTRVYVSGQPTNTVSVIDTATNTVTATVPVGDAPIGVAITPDGTRVYVACLASNAVSVIDTATNTTTDTIPVGILPILLTVAPDGAHVYVTNVGDSTVSVIDTAANTVTATIGVSAQPRLTTVSPDGKHAYVANAEPDTVSVIDTATNAVVENIDFGDGPTVIAFAPDGTHAYVTNSVAGTVGVLATTVIPDQGSTAGGATVTLTGHHLANATAVRFGTAQGVITANTDTSLTAITPAGSGAVPVTVTTAGGTGTLGQFYYRPVPVLTGISPAAGPLAGSDQEIVITGRNLDGAIDVYFGPTRAVIQRVSDTQLTIRAAATAAAGGVTVTVRTPGGRAEGLSYTYVDPPTVTGVSPTSGPTTGGTSVTITGTGLAATDQVTFNGTPAPFAVLSDTTVTATSPPSGTEGTFGVTVTGPGGNATGSFTYVSAPDI
ncbi:hypothetical protein Scani_33530 [Streptomyces caniferus]|uniref:IPT/TIG domain-containing protein n=1 Tax=Streptomyces caniferus TaxID=285557 RepID=A0A640SBV0_9ACTN|nr:hypothetical protein Scani_33530 [Streptomyces caniferus]